MGVLMTVMSRSLSLKKTPISFTNRLPAAVVAFGLVLTFVWTIFLIGFPLYLLNII
jgi:hypothetical protein